MNVNSQTICGVNISPSTVIPVAINATVQNDFLAKSHASVSPFSFRQDENTGMNAAASPPPEVTRRSNAGRRIAITNASVAIVVPSKTATVKSLR